VHDAGRAVGWSYRHPAQARQRSTVRLGTRE
jgi:hypothetical protein